MPKIFISVTVLMFLGVGITLFAGYRLSLPTNSSVEYTGTLPLKKVLLKKPNGKFTACWVLTNSGNRGAILAHGNQSNRNSMIPKAQYFYNLGYTVIMPDLSCHGETRGISKSFGLNESDDIVAAKQYLLDSTTSRSILAIGESLGSAAILSAISKGAGFDLVVIECPFPTLEIAISNRLNHYFGQLGSILTPILSIQTRIWVGVKSNEISPIQWAKRCNIPSLVLCGSKDWRATERDAKSIFEAIPSKFKQIHCFKNAGHQSFFEYNKEEYEIIFTQFLKWVDTGRM